MISPSLYVILLAAGQGTRFGEDIPKQFLKLGERYVFQYALDTFHANAKVDGIYIVVPKEYKEFITNFFQNNHYLKFRGVLLGGSNRTESMWPILDELKHLDGLTKILFHDGVRPFISNSIISSCIEILEISYTCTVAVPLVDTIATISGTSIEEVPNRDDYVSIQTPQGLYLSVLREVYQKWKLKPSLCTDICHLLKYYLQDKYSIATTWGEDQNFKITYSSDLLRAANLLKSMKQ